MSHPRPVSVTVVRRFEAPCERVFDAWLDPAVVGRWMFGPNVRDEEVLSLHSDARVGGRFSFVVRRSGARIDHVGTYLELLRPHRLAFTWAARDPDQADEPEDAGSRVLLDLVAREGGCELTLTHELDPQWAGYADRTRDAWSRMLEALARQLEPRGAATL